MHNGNGFLTLKSSNATRVSNPDFIIAKKKRTSNERVTDERELGGGVPCCLRRLLREKLRRRRGLYSRLGLQ
jgi:hypothetical protein